MRVYVAGPYSADNVLDVLKNIGRGQSVCAELFRLGYSPFCPWHDKDFVIRFPEEDFDIEQFYHYSLEWLAVSDCLLLIDGWSGSIGTMKEVMFARERGIPIYDGLDNLVIREVMKV